MDRRGFPRSRSYQSHCWARACDRRQSTHPTFDPVDLTSQSKCVHAGLAVSFMSEKSSVTTTADGTRGPTQDQRGQCERMKEAAVP